MILAGYGVVEGYCGCEIISCMETVEIGRSDDGLSVFIDRYAAEADGIIVVARIKPHTCFTGDYESGIMKMMAIGLGKQYGAQACHARGFKCMAEMVPSFGRTIIKNARVLFGLGLIENAFGKTCKVASLTREEIPRLEPDLLHEAKSLMPRILFEETDVLIIDKIGKNISGDGMDPNVSGAWLTPYKSGGIRSQRIVVLDITDESHGNGAGAGMADMGTKRLLSKFDFEKSYANMITSRILNGVKLPLILPNDRLAIQAAITTCVDVDLNSVRVVRISDTEHIGEILVSESLFEEANSNPRMEVLCDLEDMAFGEDGNLSL
jgi:hypothetical protein